MSNTPIDSILTRYAKGKKHFADKIAAGDIPLCSPGYVRGSCKNGHHFANLQFCGKEFCLDCSRDGSPIHQRRVNKWFKYVKDWDSMGYMVITIPEDLRVLFYDKEILRDFRSKLLRKCKEDYHLTKGLARYHWFGDCVHCAGVGCKDCKGTGAGDAFYPHLNILFPEGYIDSVAEYLTPLKRWMHLYFLRLVNKQIDGLVNVTTLWNDETDETLEHWLQVRRLMTAESLVVNYSYVDEAPEMMNRVKYVTRATFRRYSRDVKDLLFNFRNCIVWGWKRGEVSCDDEGDELVRFCPRCAEKGLQHILNWNKIERVQSDSYIKKYEERTTAGEQARAIYAIHRKQRGDTENHFIDWTPILNFRKKVERIQSKL